jgi:hypothetical protein
MTANSMRMQLASFEPTEQEFLDLFKKRKTYDDEFGGLFAGNLKGEEKAKQEAAKKALDDDIKTQLGEARYAEYKRSEDHAFQAMYRVADREGLGKETAIKIYDMKQAAESQAKDLRANKELPAAQRTAALQAVREETERAIKGVLGEKGFDSLERNNGAWWLKNLSPDKPAATTKQP